MFVLCCKYHESTQRCLALYASHMFIFIHLGCTCTSKMIQQLRTTDYSPKVGLSKFVAHRCRMHKAAVESMHLYLNAYILDVLVKTENERRNFWRKNLFKTRLPGQLLDRSRTGQPLDESTHVWNQTFCKTYHILNFLKNYSYLKQCSRYKRALKNLFFGSKASRTWSAYSWLLMLFVLIGQGGINRSI